MSDLTRLQIADLTGLSPSAISRHLARFPGARSGHGRYSVADPGLAQWLASFGSGSGPGQAAPVPDNEPSFVVLPSGVPISRHVWRRLRGDDEDDARAALQGLIDAWQLRPHAAVPDLLAYLPMRLTTATVNRSQWLVLRARSERAAMGALDVLTRSFGVGQ